MTVVAGFFCASNFTSDVSSWAASLALDVKKLITQSVTVNSTAFEGVQLGTETFMGSKTETALLQLAKDHLGMQSLSEARANEQVVHMVPFNSAKKYMAVVIKMPSGYRLLVKGASEIVLGFCSTQVNALTGGIEPVDRKAAEEAITAYARKSLRTIGLVYKDSEQAPDIESLSDLTLLGIVGIQDPVRPGVPDAVQNAIRAGVTTRMVTGDNIITARAIAAECGIFTDGIVMEGPEFRRMSEEERDKIIPRLQVLARSSPEDKRILVTRLKALGETVAVTGDGTNDAPALKAADVGFSMGISGTEVAKEASEIILMDDTFTSIITALKWGRAVNDAVQKFLQVHFHCYIVEPKAMANLSIVPNYRQHYCGYSLICHVHVRRRHGACTQGCATALGKTIIFFGSCITPADNCSIDQSDYGYNGCPGPGHRPSYGRHSR